MRSTVSTSDAPDRRAPARLRGAFIAATLTLGLRLLAPGVASAQLPPCLSCDPMDPVADECCPASLETPCADFFDCQDGNHAAIEACVESECKIPARYAICSAALSCSRRCARRDGSNCSVQLRTDLQDAGDCSIGRGAARRACNRCFLGGSRVCSDLLKDSTGSTCQRDCIRGQPWIQECYRKCDARCANDRCAIALCRRSCRDSICEILQNTCSPEGTAQSSLNSVQQQLRRQYKRCCDAGGGCEDDDESTVACESTTTTSTSSSSSSSSSSTSTTVQGTPTTTIVRTSTTLAPTP